MFNPKFSRLLFIALVTFYSIILWGQEKVSYSIHGVWQFSLDSLHIGETKKWYNRDLPLDIRLPGSTDEGNYGKKHINGTPLYDGKSEMYRLARKHVYIGPAWFRKEVNIPREWKNKQIFLSLERCMWQTKIWINNRYVGKNNSLCAPHQYELTNFLRPGNNIISIKVDNSPQLNLGSWSHGYSPEIQTIWNGIIGGMDLYAVPSPHIEEIQLYPSYERQELKVKLIMSNSKYEKINGSLNFKIRDGKKTILDLKEKLKNAAPGSITVTIPLKGKLKPWSDTDPQLYQLQLTSSLEKNKENKEITFGIRDLKNENGRFVLNGTKIFLRGEHDAGSFPLTGYPSMDKDEWIKIFKIGKEYGFNHWRFHSWCPPKAAFEAADEVGMILQPELSLFSQKWENTLVGQDSVLDKFLESELIRLLDTYGNHPSFGLMCMGNELKGNPEFLEKLVALAKQHDPRHLYASSANLEAMKLYTPLEGDEFMVAHSGKVEGKHVSRRMGSFNTEKPNTENDYSHTLTPPYNSWPIISHEVGQWAVYPDFREIEKFEGVLAPRNLEIFKKKLEDKGMGEQAIDFVNASGKLSVLLYREEIERLLRTPHMGGFQILDLHDYPGQGSALVGILNQFWESKGLISPEEFRQFCNDLTLLLKMPKRTWMNNELFTANLVVPNYTPASISNFEVKWKIIDNDQVIKEGRLYNDSVIQGEVNPMGTISLDLSSVSQASKLKIILEAPQANISNTYDIWIYPASHIENIPENITIATEIDSTLYRKIFNGASVLLVTDKFPDTEKMTFTTPFWSTIMFNYQVKTMGILCNPNHPIFNSFPTDFHTDWQWWELLKEARVLRLNQTANNYRPLLQVIDHAVRNDKLGAIMETKIGKGKLLLSTLDILSKPDQRYVARQLKNSILKYMASAAFHPNENEKLIQILFPKEKYAENSIRSVKSTHENPRNPASSAFDNNPETYWEIKTKDETVNCIVEFDTPRFITGCSISLKDSTINPVSFTIYVTDNPDNPGTPVITGNIPGTDLFEAIR